MNDIGVQLMRADFTAREQAYQINSNLPPSLTGTQIYDYHASVFGAHDVSIYGWTPGPLLAAYRTSPDALNSRFEAFTSANMAISQAFLGQPMADELSYLLLLNTSANPGLVRAEMVQRFGSQYADPNIGILNSQGMDAAQFWDRTVNAWSFITDVVTGSPQYLPPGLASGQAVQMMLGAGYRSGGLYEGAAIIDLGWQILKGLLPAPVQGFMRINDLPGNDFELRFGDGPNAPGLRLNGDLIEVRGSTGTLGTISAGSNFTVINGDLVAVGDAGGGCRIEQSFDLGGVRSWQTETRLFDLQGQLDTRSTTYDNGTRTDVDYDQANTSIVGSITSVYDGQGRLDTRETRNDDGSRVSIDYDQATTETWATALSRSR